MPRRDTQGTTLHEAHDRGMLVRVRCEWCRTQRHYQPDDLRRLLGNREIDSLRRRMKCEGCGKRDYVEVEGKFFTGQERLGLTLRRLKAIQLVQKPIWEDEPL